MCAEKHRLQKNLKNNKYITDGEFGCFLSHLQVWEDMVENNIDGIIYGNTVYSNSRGGIDLKETVVRYTIHNNILSNNIYQNSNASMYQYINILYIGATCSQFLTQTL